MRSRRWAWFTGGENSPYIWHKVPDGMTSWEFFDYLLNEAEVVGTPGSGFGKNGEGFFRLTAFGTLEKTQEAMECLKKLLKKSFKRSQRGLCKTCAVSFFALDLCRQVAIMKLSLFPTEDTLCITKKIASL